MDADADRDGYGDPSTPQVACSLLAGTVEDVADRDDGDADVNPEAAEVCKGADDDLDGQIDEAGAQGESPGAQMRPTDGFGDAGRSVTACSVPDG